MSLKARLTLLFYWSNANKRVTATLEFELFFVRMMNTIFT